jgi:hypothetical protein
MDDGRTPLMQGLKPSETTTVQLWITAPTAPGTYILELDMVKEGVAWFRQKGSKTCRAKVEVRGGVIQQPASKRPVMEMHCVPKLDVLSVVEAAGGTPVLVTEDHSADPLLSYQYVVTKTNERRKSTPPKPIRVAASTTPAAVPSQSDEILALLAGLAQHATLHARVNEGLVKRILEIEKVVRETQKMVSDLCKGTQSEKGSPGHGSR